MSFAVASITQPAKGGGGGNGLFWKMSPLQPPATVNQGRQQIETWDRDGGSQLFSKQRSQRKRVGAKFSCFWFYIKTQTRWSSLFCRQIDSRTEDCSDVQLAPNRNHLTFKGNGGGTLGLTRRRKMIKHTLLYSRIFLINSVTPPQT